MTMTLLCAEIPYTMSFVFSNLLIRNLIRLCESKFPALTGKRALVGPHDFRVNLERHGSPVQFQLSPMVTLLSKDLLKPVLPVIEDTRSVEQPDLYPFNSLINFENKNIYEDGDFLGNLGFTLYLILYSHCDRIFAFISHISAVQAESPFPYIHTTAFSHHIPGSFTHIRPRWNADRYAGCTVLYAFSTALLMARRKFGVS